MKQSNSRGKALSALLGVAFMLLFALTSCKQTGGGDKPNPTLETKKHAITFSVDGTTPNGMLKAKY